MFFCSSYLNNLDRIGLRDTDIAENQKNNSFIRSNLKSLVILILGFPLHVYGVINNYLPFEIPVFAAKKISKSIEYRGAVGMVGGMT